MEYVAIITLILGVGALLAYLAINLQDSHPLLSITYLLSILVIFLIAGGVIDNITDLSVEFDASKVNATKAADNLQNNIDNFYRFNILLITLSFMYVLIYLAYASFHRMVGDKE